MSIEADIYEGMVENLEVFNASLSPSLPVIYPGVGGEPPNEGLWLEVRHFPNEPQNYGLADAGPTKHRGFFQVEVCNRPGEGIVASLQMADALVVAFGKGMTAGPARIESKPSIMSGVEEADRIKAVVRVPYTAILRDSA